MSGIPGWGQPPQDNYPPPQPGYTPPPAPGAPGAMTCPKCSGSMRTYDRNGVHIEQCTTCRGIFLDFGELESLTRLESQVAQHSGPPPQQHANYGPGWGNQGNHKYRKGGFGRLFFSS